MEKSLKNKRIVIPGIFTTLNIFCGFLAILKIYDDRILYACWLIVFAAIFDALDGQLARITKSTSEFGVEFDSLADIVSFGVAPAMLLYHLFLKKFGILGTIGSFLPLICGGFRLARFNVQLTGFEKTKFSGLPIPIAAISFSSFVIFNYHFWNEIYLTRFLGPQIVFICLLMISTVEYYTLPKLTFKRGHRHSLGIIIMFSTMVILIIYPQETLYPISIAYAIWGVMRFLYRIVIGDIDNTKKAKLDSK